MPTEDPEPAKEEVKPVADAAFLIDQLDVAILSLNPLTGFAADSVWRPADRARKAMIAARDALAAPPPAEARREGIARLLEDAKGLFNQIALQRRKIGPLGTHAQQMAHQIEELLKNEEGRDA